LADFGEDTHLNEVDKESQYSQQEVNQSVNVDISSGLLLVLSKLDQDA
jgi:hypothetical protein